jgi:hypothetical protein
MLISTKSFTLEITSTIVFIKAFDYECCLHPTEQSSWAYHRESNTEREIHLGSRVLIVSTL